MSAHANCLKFLLAALWLWQVAPAGTGVAAVYSNDFRDHYPSPGRKYDLGLYQLEAPAVIWDEAHDRRITIRRTRGDKYGYEQQRCVMTIEGKGFSSPRFLSVLGFRSIEASWLTGKLVVIKLDIGHVAGVDAIYDSEADKLIYCESVSYATEPSGGAGNESQPIRPKANPKEE